jgi:hypothetical protein
MGFPQSGIDGYIYVDGNALQGANAWDITIPSEAVEQRKFGDDWVSRSKTFNDANGTIDAIDDVKILYDAATGSSSVLTYIYPNRGTTGEYWYGNAIFGTSGSGSVDGNVTAAGDWVGDGAWTWVE